MKMIQVDLYFLFAMFTNYMLQMMIASLFRPALSHVRFPMSCQLIWSTERFVTAKFGTYKRSFACMDSHML